MPHGRLRSSADGAGGSLLTEFPESPHQSAGGIKIGEESVQFGNKAGGIGEPRNLTADQHAPGVGCAQGSATPNPLPAPGGTDGIGARLSQDVRKSPHSAAFPVTG
jgi:hypothetical protein